MRKINLLIIMVIMFSVLVIAEDQNTFNPEQPELFDYTSGDYSTITDWSKVDWSQFPSERITEIPVAELNYIALNPEQRKSMSSEQIWYHIDNVEDLSKDVDPETAKKALKENTGIKVESFGPGARVEAGILKSTIGEKDQLVMNGKSGWLVTINENGEIIVSGSEKDNVDENGETFSETVPLEESSLSSQDSFKINGANLQLKEGREITEISGLSYAEGEFFVKKGEVAVFDKLEVGTIDKEDKELKGYRSERLKIYFDGEEHTGDYVSIGEKKIILNSNTPANIFFSPQPGNKFFDMLKRDYQRDASGKVIPGKYTWVPDERDFLKIRIAGGTRLTFENREEEGKIPLMTAVLPERLGEMELKSGDSIHFLKRQEDKETGFERRQLPEKDAFTRNSVPFEWKYVGKVDQEKYNLIVSSSNRVVVLDEEGKKEIDYANQLKVTNQLEFNRLKTIDDLRVRFPNINFGISPYLLIEEEVEDERRKVNEEEPLKPTERYQITPHMAQFMVEMGEEYPERIPKIKEVLFSNNNDAHNDGDKVGTLLFGEEVLLTENGEVREIDGPKEIFEHETNHMIDGYTTQKEKDLGDKTLPTLEEVYREIGESAIKELANNPTVVASGEKIDLDKKQRLEDNRNRVKTMYVVGIIKEEMLNSLVDISPEELSSLEIKKEEQKREVEQMSQEEQRKYNSDLTKKKMEWIGVQKEMIGQDFKKDYDDSNPVKTYIERISNEQEKIDQEIERLNQVIIANEEEIKRPTPRNLFGQNSQQPPKKKDTSYEKGEIRKAKLKIIELEKKEIDVKNAKKPLYDLIPLEGGEYTLNQYLGEGEFAELATVPLEIPPERAAKSIQGGNEVLRKVTQVAYDVGKIDEVEYRQRMGRYCDNNPCGKCIVYQLTCEN